MGFFSVDGFGAFTFVGLDNYKKMLIDPTFWQCLRVTSVYVALIVPAFYVSGLGLALLVQRTNRFNTVMNGNLEEAARYRDQYLADHPDSKLADYIFPFKPKDLNHYFEGLRRAGFV